MSPYSSLPHQIDEWFKAFHKAKEMCGPPGTQKRMPPKKEIEYLDALVRGVYAKGIFQKDIHLPMKMCIWRSRSKGPALVPRADAGRDTAEGGKEGRGDLHR